ncbi:MAG: LysR substrate-binding domain-containing protein [Myxococcaceae bacterium]|nr:LysR substrate-binding domain-containing protein [Myxococcaceae bacterium]MCI0669700.1 LysR substrate-binding domain-containing protein [Myxococcaceae bacterium]
MSLRAHWLPALGAFEAAARHQNFARAGAELHLTASAVSHHVRRLEGLLGVTLFQRQARGVALTPEGRLLADATGGALGDLNAALASLQARRRTPRVRISTLPSLAHVWLVPRLGRFSAAHPEIGLAIDADRALARFDEGGPDLALRYGVGDWPDLVSHFLMDDTMFPAAAPDLPGVERVQTPEDIARLPLVGDLSPQGWAEWFRHAGVRHVQVTELHTFSDSTDALNAAAAGLGVVLARQRLAGPHLADGRLKRLPGPGLPTRNSYYLVHPASRPPSAAVRTFMTWLQREAQADEATQPPAPRRR